MNWGNMLGSKNFRQAPKKMSKLQTATIIIIAFTVVIATFYYLGIFDEFQALDSEPEPTQPPLTPARRN